MLIVSISMSCNTVSRLFSLLNCNHVNSCYCLTASY